MTRKSSSVKANAGETVTAVPAELKRAFQSNKEAQTIFDQLSPSHQREYLKWINEAKKTETRQKRVAETIAMLKKVKK